MIAALFLAFSVPLTVWAAPSATVHTFGIYTDTTFEVYLYADIQECNLISFGVNVGYNPADLTVVSAVKNEAVWYLGEAAHKYPYMNPDTATTGEVVIIGGKLDISTPAAGVTGNDILLGHISFARNNLNIPVLSLTYGRAGSYKNFVTTASLVLDDQVNGVIFDSTIPMVGTVHSADTNRVAFFGCFNNTNGILANLTCGGTWDFGAPGQIVGGNGNNIIVYQYDATGDFSATLTTVDAVNTLAVASKNVEIPLPVANFITAVNGSTVTLTPSVLPADVAQLTVFWGDRNRTVVSDAPFQNPINQYTRTGTSYHIRVQLVDTGGNTFNYTFMNNSDLTVTIP